MHRCLTARETQAELVLSDFLRPLRQLPPRESFSVLRYPHIVQALLLCPFSIFFPASTLQAFWICVLVDVMLIVELGLRVARDALVRYLGYQVHVVLATRA